MSCRIELDFQRAEIEAFSQRSPVDNGSLNSTINHTWEQRWHWHQIFMEFSPIVFKLNGQREFYVSKAGDSKQGSIEKKLIVAWKRLTWSLFWYLGGSSLWVQV